MLSRHPRRSWITSTTVFFPPSGRRKPVMTCWKYAGCSVLIGLCLALTGCSRALRPGTSSAPEKSSFFCPDPLKANAVAVFYEASGNPYYTKQEHCFCPSLKKLEISADEPQGQVQWRWDKNSFARVPSVKNRSASEWQADSLYTLWAGFLYGSGLLSTTLPTTDQTASLDGIVYTPFSLTDGPSDLQAVLYQNRKTGLFDRVRVFNPKEKKELTAILYNWSLFGRDKRIVPRKIDIFDTTNGLSSKKLIIQVDYKEIQ